MSSWRRRHDGQVAAVVARRRGQEAERGVGEHVLGGSVRDVPCAANYGLGGAEGAPPHPQDERAAAAVRTRDQDALAAFPAATSRGKIQQGVVQHFIGFHQGPCDPDACKWKIAQQ